jgi:hypothetical protein
VPLWLCEKPAAEGTEVIVIGFSWLIGTLSFMAGKFCESDTYKYLKVVL